MFPESHRYNSSCGDQVLAAVSTVSGVLYCFKKHLTSDLVNSLQSLMKSGDSLYVEQGF
ncbi:hypothetical protein VIMY103929_05385 [Vibrio mytili]